MSRPILECNICGKEMVKGKRVAITLNWECDANDVTNRIQKNKIICRTCARKISKAANMEVPNV